MAILMLKPMAQRQKSPLILSTQKLLVLSVQRHFVTWSTALPMPTICALFCVGNLALSNKVYCRYGKLVFHCVSLLKNRVVCTVVHSAFNDKTSL